MSKDIGKIMDLSIKTDMAGEITSKPNLEMLDKEINSLFGRDGSFRSVPVKSGSQPKFNALDVQQETSFIPRSVPKPKESGSTFAFSDVIARSKTSSEYETSQEGHSAKGVREETAYDGSVSTKWEGVNQEHVSYRAEGKEKGNTLEINSRGKNGEFEGNARITREDDGTKKEYLNIKNNKTGAETSYTLETMGREERHSGRVKTSEGNVTAYELEKSRGKVLREMTRTEFVEGGLEVKETLRDKEKMIKNMSLFSEKYMEEFVGLNFTEKEAIGVIARNLKEGKISSARIKKEIFEENAYLNSMWEEGTLLELLEEEYTLSLDKENSPLCSRLNKIYDKEGNLIGEEEEETFYRSGENPGDREYVIMRRTFEFIDEKRLQTGEEEFIDCFPVSRKKNIQFSKTYFQGGKKVSKRTDRIEKGDVSEEYRDLSDIMETGRKLLFARLLEGKTQELSIRHHRDIFYDAIETEDGEIRSTIYKSLQNPSVLLMRIDLLKGYTMPLPLWILTVTSQTTVNTQFLFEGMKDSTFLDRFDTTTSYHVFRCTLREKDLAGEVLREASRAQIHLDEEAKKKFKKEQRSHLEFRFSDRANSLFKVHLCGWLNNPSHLSQKGDDLSSAEMVENIIYCLVKYLNPDNKSRRENALEKRHIFLPLVTTGEIGLETLLGYKFGLELVFLLWEMLNIVGHGEGKDRLARIKV